MRAEDAMRGNLCEGEHTFIIDSRIYSGNVPVCSVPSGWIMDLIEAYCNGSNFIVKFTIINDSKDKHAT